LLSAACLVATSGVLAQDGRSYRPGRPYPWENSPGYRGYKEPPPDTQPTGPAAQPRKYTIYVSVMPAENPQDDPNTSLVLAHLPEDARIWFDGQPTQHRGTLRRFRTPPLSPDKDYSYTVKVEWFEEGHWVSQTHSFAVLPGMVHCLDIVPSDSQAVKERAAANLAQLEPADRKVAEEQRFCAVQEGILLGAMGVPVKVMLNGQPVLVCCEGCVKKAQSEPEQTLAQVRKLKAKNAPPSPR
jgi:uncharacterized protein (TIGR03000 family)